MNLSTTDVQPVFLRIPASDEFSRECVEFFGEAVQFFGIPSSVGQIYGVLYASPVPLSFSDIFERLDISKGSASQGLNLLRSLGAVHEVEPVEANGRREYFVPELRLRALLRGLLEDRVRPLATSSAGRLDRLRTLAGEGGGRDKKFRLSRVQQLETWRRRLKTAIPVVGALLGPTGEIKRRESGDRASEGWSGRKEVGSVSEPKGRSRLPIVVGKQDATP